MNKYRISAEHILNHKRLNGTIICKNLKVVMELLASYGYIVNRLVTLS